MNLSDEERLAWHFKYDRLVPNDSPNRKDMDELISLTQNNMHELGYQACIRMIGIMFGLEKVPAVPEIEHSIISQEPYLSGLPVHTHTDCRTEEGITVGLIDSLISICRVLSKRDLAGHAAVEALRDFWPDPDVQKVILAASVSLYANRLNKPANY